MAKHEEYIYKVTIIHPADSVQLPNGAQSHTGSSYASEHYFGSLAAIYDEFSREDIGCALQRLYECKVSDGYTYSSGKAIVSRHPIHRKAKKSPKNGENAK